MLVGGGVKLTPPSLGVKKKLIIDNSLYLNDKDMKFYTMIGGIKFYKLNILFFSIMAEFCDDVIIYLFS